MDDDDDYVDDFSDCNALKHNIEYCDVCETRYCVDCEQECQCEDPNADTWDPAEPDHFGDDS